MNTDTPERIAIPEPIIGCAFAVASTLGRGFLEKAYENALALELPPAALAAIAGHSRTGRPVWAESVAASASIRARSPSSPSGFGAVPPSTAVTNASSSARYAAA